MLKAKVKNKKRKYATANTSANPMGASAKAPEFVKPTLAQQVQMREIMTARQAEMGANSAMRGMDDGMSPAMKGIDEGGAKAKKSSGPKDADIYDERIGGYGKSMGAKESGEQAVRRIMKVKKKKKA